jgi:hypothetical protein
MTGPLFHRALAMVVLGMVLGLPGAQAKDRAFDRDWRTGVIVAPGAMTWTDDSLQQKEKLIRDIAAARGKTCTHYAFLGWPPGSGGGSVILPQTRKNYEAAGYTVEEKPGDIPTDTIWTVANRDREAMILWGGVAGSTIYLSCLTAGAPAPSAEKAIYVGVLLALGLAGLAGGLWLMRRVRALGAASLGWPSAAGTIKASSVESYRTQGGKQYMAKVAYDYAVNGAPYSGDRVRFGNRAGALAVAEADVAKYAAGAPVEVRYDPGKPQISTLEGGQGGVGVGGIVLAIIGAGAAALALVILVAT